MSTVLVAEAAAVAHWLEVAGEDSLDTRGLVGVPVLEPIVVLLDLGVHALREELVPALARLEAFELELLKAVSFVVAVNRDGRGLGH